MNTAAARAAHIDRRLAELYPDTPVPLDHTSPYTLLIAVLLSAQCTDKRVNLQTPGLFAKADTPRKMVRLSVEEIDAHVRPCGLAPRKAQAIRRLSEILIEKHGGEVPSCPALGTRRPRWLWRRLSASLLFRSTRISTVLRSAGDSRVSVGE
jgi:endonuclease-3